MSTYIALLRGINVGGRAKVPMAELRDVAESVGFVDPVTYIQSGNLVLGADIDEAEVLEELEAALDRRFGFAIPVVVRTYEEFATVAASHPMAATGIDPKLLMVAFLDRAPRVDIDEAIDAAAYLPDRFELDGRHVYLSYPNGSGRSKLDHALLERSLGVRATIRNWNTIGKLAELAGR